MATVLVTLATLGGVAHGYQCRKANERPSAGDRVNGSGRESGNRKGERFECVHSHTIADGCERNQQRKRALAILETATNMSDL